MKRTGRDSPLVTAPVCLGLRWTATVRVGLVWVRVYDPDGPSKARQPVPARTITLGNGRDGTLRPHHQRSALRIAAHRIESNPELRLPPDAPRVIRRPQVEYKVLPDDKNSFCGNRLHPHFFLPALPLKLRGRLHSWV